MSGSTRKLLIVFGVLLVVTVAWNSLERRRTTSRVRSFEKVAVEDVTRGAISGKGNDVTMEQRGGVWMITAPIEYPANQILVEDLLEKVGELSTVNVVSNNPANHDPPVSRAPSWNPRPPTTWACGTISSRTSRGHDSS